MPIVNIYYCSKCMRTDIEYDGMVVSDCPLCEKTMEKIGWLEHEDDVK